MKGVLVTAVVFVLAMLAPAIASAATLKVDVDGTDDGTCIVDACATLGYAVEQAQDGDTVQVAKGSFEVDATVVVDQAVTISGTQAGVDARNRELPEADETVISPSADFTAGAPLIRLSAPGATVDGVTIQGHNRAAVQMMNTSSGYAVRNSILTGNDVGIDLETTEVDPEPTIVERNRFDANDSRSLRSGIYGDHTASDVTIRDNRFLDHPNVPINISGGADRVQKDIVIEGNTFENERHLVLWTADGVRVSGNTFAGGRAQAISVQGGVENLEITDNTITRIADAGILFVDYYDVGPNRSAIIVGNSIGGTNADEVVDAAGIAVSERSTDGPGTSGNPGYEGTLTVTGNRIIANGLAGLRNDVEGVEVDAENNWWGCNAGPGSEGCDATVGSVDSDPNLVLTVESSAGAIQTGGSATITARLNTNSANQSAPGVPDLTPVSLATNLGTIAPELVGIEGGSAQAQFSAGATAGTATISAGVDNETVSVQIAVTDPPAPPSPPAPPAPPAPPQPPADDPVAPPAPKEVRDEASRSLGAPSVVVTPTFRLASLQFLVPRTSRTHRTPKPRIPVVSGKRIKIHAGAIGRRLPQRIGALGSLRGGHRAVVTQKVKIGRKTVSLPRQRVGVGQGGAKAVNLPITNAMKKLLMRGRSVVLTLRVTAVDDSGKKRSAVKRFRIEGEKPKNRGKRNR